MVSGRMNISSTMRAFWAARLEAAQAQLLKAEAAYSAGLLEIERYTLDTGEARQTVEHRDIAKLERAVTRLEARVVWLNQKINGGGLVNLNLRRRG